MSWSELPRPSRRAALLLLLGAAAGCGFRPLHETGGAGGGISIREAVTPEDYAFRERLRRRLGLSEGFGGRVDFTLYYVEDGVAITPEANITRYRVTATANYRFEPSAGGAAIEGKTRSVGGYDAAGDAFPARAAMRDERKRLAEDLAERVAVRLLAARAS